MSEGTTPVIIVLDTETTGLMHTPEALPCELAAVALDADGREVSCFSSVIKVPTPAWATPALGINRISRDEIEAAPSPLEVRAQFLEWWSKAPGAYVTSFNLPFDKGMLYRMWPALVLPWGSCVMREAWRLGCDGGLARVAAQLRVPVQEPQHRALADARTAAGVTVALRRRVLARMHQAEHADEPGVTPLPDDLVGYARARVDELDTAIRNYGPQTSAGLVVESEFGGSVGDRHGSLVRSRKEWVSALMFPGWAP